MEIASELDFFTIKQNLSHKYSSYNSKIKYVDLLIKYIINFKLFHYAISLDDVSSFLGHTYVVILE